MDWLEKLSSSKFLVVTTGAGISAESGIPTFRGEDGLWKSHRAEELATPYAFNNSPELVWEWYNWRREIIQTKSPNKGHYAIAELENIFPNFLLITQNVDDMHRKAGSKKIIELHGNIFRNKCSKCGKQYSHTSAKELLYCDCKGVLRPDVVWFGESIPQIEEAFDKSSQCDFMIVVGTSGLVEPAASLPRFAKENGAFVLEINISETPITFIADYSIFDKAGTALSDLVDKMKNGRTDIPVCQKERIRKEENPVTAG